MYDTFVLSATAAALLIIPLVVALFVFGVIYLKKGAAFSARRWNRAAPAGAPAGETAPEPVPAAAAKAPAHQGTGTYKAVIARILFALCAGFWALLIIGMMENTKDNPGGIPELIAGGIILTVIPAAIGIILEVSYRRSKEGRGGIQEIYELTYFIERRNRHETQHDAQQNHRPDRRCSSSFSRA